MNDGCNLVLAEPVVDLGQHIKHLKAPTKCSGASNICTTVNCSSRTCMYIPDDAAVLLCWLLLRCVHRQGVGQQAVVLAELHTTQLATWGSSAGPHAAQ
jgi:hypothetical protein